MGNPRNPGIFPMAFGAGLSNDVDSRHADGASLLVSENVRFDRSGRVSKRFGMIDAAATTSSGTLAGDNAGIVVNHNGTPAVFDDRGAYRLRGTTLQRRGEASDITGVTSSEIVSVMTATEYDVENADVAEGGGYICVAWVGGGADYNDVFFVLKDAATGTSINTAQKLTSSNDINYARVVAVTNAGVTSFWILAQDTATNRIDGYNISTDGVLLSTVNFATNVFTARPASCEATVIDNQIYVTCMTTAGVPRIFCRDSAGASVFSTATVDAADGTTNKYGWAIAGYTGEQVIITYSGEVATVPYIRWNVYSLAGAFAASNSIADEAYTIGLIRYAADDYVLIHYRNIGTNVDFSVNGYRLQPSMGADSSVGIFTSTYWTLLASKPFFIDGRIYFWGACGNQSDFGFLAYTEAYRTFVLFDAMVGFATATLAKPVAVFQADNAIQSTVSSVTQYGTVMNTVTTAAVNTLRLVDVNKDTLRTACVLGENLCVNAGMLQAFDGDACVEAGFLYWPTRFAYVSTAFLDRIESFNGAGAMTPGDSFSYKFCYSRVDAYGNILRSASSFDETIVVDVGHDSVRFRMPHYCVTAYGSNFESYRNHYIEIYRSGPNPITGAPYNLLDIIPNFIDTGYSDFYVDDYSLTYTNIEKKPILLMDDNAGSAYSNVMPPNFSVVAAHRGRVYGAAVNAIWYSKEILDGESVQFANEQTIELVGESVVAMQSLDDKLVIFTESKIYALYGDGPSDTGAGVQFGQPLPISTDIGCIAPRSLCQYQDGIMFQSRAGIYVITRDLQVGFIGQPILGTITGEIISCMVHPSENTIIMVQDNTTDRIVYDYRLKAWSVDKLEANIVSQASIGGTYYALVNNTGAATVSRQKEDVAYLDGTDWITMKVRFGWTKLGEGAFLGVQQSRKVHGLFEKFTNAGLTLSLYTSFSTTADVTNTWTSTEINALSDLPVFKLSQAFTNARSTAATLEISDIVPVATTGTGRGHAFLGVAYDIEGFAGETRKPADNKG